MQNKDIIDVFFKARKAASIGEYDKAVNLISKVPDSYHWDCQDLIFKARIIQLSDKQQIFSLEDAETALTNALEISHTNVEVLIEMGYYQYLVNADTNAGIDYFMQAKKICMKYQEEIDEFLSKNGAARSDKH